MTETITTALLALDSPGSFAVRVHVPADALRLAVTRVGPVEFPVPPATATRLLAVASRSPFGRGEQTIVDPSVRSGWEVAKSRIKIDGRRWNPVLRGILDSLTEQLGTPGRLTARLDKLTIYGPGEFFKAHQDTQKSVDMIASLVVLLPSPFSGGALHVDRQGETIEFRRTAKAAKQLEILAFYADCHHEVRPVKTGYRMALVYQLEVERGAARVGDASSLAPAQLQALEHAVASYFSSPQSRQYGNRTFIPETLIYLLDHQYTPQGLAWTNLKHADGVRVTALRSVADALGLDAHLALADIHEIWQCEPRFRPRRWSRWSRFELERSDDEYDLQELVDSDVVLRHCQSISGAPVGLDALTVDLDELCFTTANDDLHPFESTYEGYMGNYGDTLDRSYHRAAIVLWPKANAFIIEAKLDPSAALRQLRREYKATATRDAALQRLHRLLEVWPSCVGHEPGARLLVQALEFGLLVADPSLAAALLDPVKPPSLPASAVRPLLRLAEAYGMDWCQHLLRSWYERNWASQWRTAATPSWLAKLVSPSSELGLELGQFIVAKQWAEIHAKLCDPHTVQMSSVYTSSLSTPVIERFKEMLSAAAIVEDRATRNSIVATLLSDASPLATLEIAKLIEDARGVEGVDELAESCREQLARALAKPARVPGDWSIIIPRICECRDCATLHEFLESQEPGRSWPLAKDRRKHIHGIIDGRNLPVTHTTSRTGRPHKLMLSKSAQLPAIETKLRKTWAAALARLRK